MTSIYLIRHGETDWNIEGRYQGQANPPLNERGLSQSQQLAESLEGVGIEALYSSPLRRAWQTAHVLSVRLKIPLISESRLVEIHQGDWQTRLRSEIEMLYPELFLKWETQPWDVTPPGGENLFEVHLRVIAAIEDIVDQNPGRQVGIVTHRIPIALIKLHFQGMDKDIVRTIQLPNTHWEKIDLTKK